MAKRYSRLELKLPPTLKIADFSFKFIIKNSSTDKVVYADEGKFDVGGFTKWFEIMQVNRTLYYEIYQKNRQTNKNIKVQTVLAKAYEKQNNWSLYTYKVSSGTTKNEKENIKEIYLNNGEAAWYLIKKKETATSWARKVYKNQLAAKDWEILKQNNPHIPQFDSKAMLSPGQVIILSNSTTAKELPEYKKLAKEAHKNLEKMVYGQGVDAQFFAQNYEFLHAVLEHKNQRISKTAFDNNNDPLTIRFNTEDKRKEEGFFEAKMVADARLVLEEGRVSQIYQRHGVLIDNYAKAGIKGAPNASIKFSQFRVDNAKLIAELRTNYASSILNWDPTPKTKNLRKILNKTVPIKGTVFQNGLKGYVKNMMKVGEAGIYLKRVGYMSIGYDALIAVNEVNNAQEGKKARTAVVETTKLGVGIGTGAMTTALVIGLATGGTGLVVIGVVAISAMVAGKATGDILGNTAGNIYDYVEKR